MKQVRTRDFIYTSDDLYFASTNYIHPENRVISFLRYAFIFTIIINFIGWQITERKEKSSFSTKIFSYFLFST